MGDISDAMLDGTLDAETGEFIGEPCGYPRVIRNGREVPQHELYRHKAKPTTLWVRCKVCKKKCRGHDGLAAHMKAKHGTPGGEAGVLAGSVPPGRKAESDEPAI